MPKKPKVVFIGVGGAGAAFIPYKAENFEEEPNFWKKFLSRFV